MKTKTLKAAVATALVALAAVPASSLGATKFGAELTPDTQPSNSSAEGAPCELGNDSLCTRVSMEAYGRPDGGERAPKSGTIKKISVISQGPDTFRFELAEAKPSSEQAKVVYRSKKLHTQGQADPNADTYTIETFKVNAPVKKGQYLATESKTLLDAALLLGWAEPAPLPAGAAAFRTVRDRDRHRRLLALARSQDQVVATIRTLVT